MGFCKYRVFTLSGSRGMRISVAVRDVDPGCLEQRIGACGGHGRGCPILGHCWTIRDCEAVEIATLRHCNA